eukprot:gene15084-biopygen3648
MYCSREQTRGNGRHGEITRRFAAPQAPPEWGRKGKGGEMQHRRRCWAAGTIQQVTQSATRPRSGEFASNVSRGLHCLRRVVRLFVIARVEVGEVDFVVIDNVGRDLVGRLAELRRQPFARGGKGAAPQPLPWAFTKVASEGRAGKEAGPTDAGEARAPSFSPLVVLAAPPARKALRRSLARATSAAPPNRTKGSPLELRDTRYGNQPIAMVHHPVW